MTVETIVQFFLPVVGGLLGIIVMVIGGIAQQMGRNWEKTDNKLDEINATLAKIEIDLRCELAGLDRRVSLVESHLADIRGR